MNIEVGQLWKDMDKRRERDGTVRTFIILDVGTAMIVCRELSTERTLLMRPERFGNGRKNDSFVLVSEAK
jgi:hypothetical protein